MANIISKRYLLNKSEPARPTMIIYLEYGKFNLLLISQVQIEEIKLRANRKDNSVVQATFGTWYRTKTKKKKEKKREYKA